MKDDHKTKQQLLGEVAELRQRFAELKASGPGATSAAEAFPRTYRALKVLSRCSRAVVHVQEEASLLDEICHTLVEVGGYRLAWIGFAGQDEEKRVIPVAQAGCEEGYLDTVAITWAETSRGRGPTGTAIRERRHMVVRNITTDPNYRPWRSEALKRGYASSIALPLLDAQQCLGVLNVYAPEPDAFDEEEVNLLTDLAADLAHGIKALRINADCERAQAALLQSKEQYRMLVETMKDGLGIQDENGFLVYVNRRFLDMLGCTWSEAIGRRVIDFLDEANKKIYKDQMLRRQRGEHQPYEIDWKKKNGQRIFTIVSPQPIFDADGRVTGSFAVFTDITDQKQTEEALRRSERELRHLSSQLLTIQEKERGRIARELHDSIGQSLSAIKFKLEDVLGQNDRDALPAAMEPCSSLIPMIQNTIEELRRISMDLHPSTLDDLGILATIAWFCREFQSIFSGIRIETDICVEEDHIPESLKIVMYRIIQEALNNVSRHSQADLVRLGLSRSDGILELSIEDNGCGFDPEQSSLSGESLKKGFGLASMRERTEFSGGSFAVESVRDKGTVVRATWSWQEQGSIS
ncbi:MAG: PAS domain S-box protein [Syntrophobacteria bacterium]